MVERRDRWPRRCPACATEFESVQCWGVCPKCQLRFLVDNNGSVISQGNLPEDRSIPRPFFVPRDVDQFADELPLPIKSRVKAEFSESDVPTAMRFLARYGARSHELNPDRIWTLALDGASGNLDRLESAIEQAQTDYRDFLRMYDHV